MGESPVRFEFDMDKAVTLRILNEGYQARTEQLPVGWNKSECHQGHCSEGDYPIGGTLQRDDEVRTPRDLIRLHDKAGAAPAVP